MTEGDARPRREPGAELAALAAWLGRLLDDVRQLVRERVTLAAEAVHEEIDVALAHAAARLRRGAIWAGALAAGSVLLVLGLSGAVGEWLGRPWRGELAVGVLVVGVALAWPLLGSNAARQRARRRAARKEG